MVAASNRHHRLDLNASLIPIDPSRDSDQLLPHCWRLQDCYSCLHAQYHCSWCPIVCVSSYFPGFSTDVSSLRLVYLILPLGLF